MNTFNSTVTPNELPRLSAENFEECQRLYNHVDVPPLTVSSIIATCTETNRYETDRYTTYKFVDPEILDDGEPTEWTLWVVPDGRAPWISINHSFNCVYEWCEGHELSEAGEFDSLLHQSNVHHVKFKGSVLTAEARVDKCQTEPIGVNVWIDTDVDIQIDQIATLRDELDEFQRKINDLGRIARDLQMVDELVQVNR